MQKVLKPLYWKNNTLYILDQKKLPTKIEFIEVRTLREAETAIKEMHIRGAPAIGIAAGYALALWALRHSDKRNFFKGLREAGETLLHTRPTAVNIRWAVERIIKKVEATRDPQDALREARKIHKEDIIANQKMGDIGAHLIKDGWKILTHCNAGALATGGYGTALGVIRSAIKMGKKIKVFANETRPFLQGARLTAWELHRDRIDVTVITDSTAGFLMQRKEISAIIVGADRITSNGDFANKIGTYSLAVLSYHHRIPFYVVAPSSSFDLNLEHGEEIPIEERKADEIVHCGNIRLVPKGVKVKNISFDITPHKFVTAFITEKGIIEKPFKKNIRKVMGVR